jgi:flagellar hook-basal body protein
MTMWWFQTQPLPGLQAQWEWAIFWTPNGAAPTDAAVATATMTQDPALAGVKIWDSQGYSPGGTAAAIVNSDTAVNPVSFNTDGSLFSNGTGTPNNVILAMELDNGAIGTGGLNNLLRFSLNMGTPADPVGPPIVAGLRDGLTGDYGNGTYDPLTGVYQPQQTIYTDFVDGYPDGTLTGLSFNQTGGVDARFSNGQVIEVAKVALSKFSNQDGLERIGGNYFRATANSGLAQVGVAGTAGFGLVQGGTLEGSNVDLTVELTNMILAQRMFESNARVVTASDRVLDTLVNLGR